MQKPLKYFPFGSAIRALGILSKILLLTRILVDQTSFGEKRHTQYFQYDFLYCSPWKFLYSASSVGPFNLVRLFDQWRQRYSTLNMLRLSSIVVCLDFWKIQFSPQSSSTKLKKIWPFKFDVCNYNYCQGVFLCRPSSFEAYLKLIWNLVQS